MKFTNLKVLDQKSNASNVQNVWQYQSHLRTLYRSLSYPSLQPFVTFTSHVHSSVSVLLSNLIIPWKFVTISCFYSYPLVSQVLWGKLFPMVAGILRNTLLIPILQKNSTQPGHLLYSALMKPVAFGRYDELLSPSCQLWHEPLAAQQDQVLPE